MSSAYIGDSFTTPLANNAPPSGIFDVQRTGGYAPRFSGTFVA
ncbi:MAG: hypothetical protein ABIU06_15910 [Anaerolineales bacterium]